jgi:hypothetical protein
MTARYEGIRDIDVRAVELKACRLEKGCRLDNPWLM